MRMIYNTYGGNDDCHACINYITDGGDIMIENIRALAADIDMTLTAKGGDLDRKSVV